jgi:hypothetical protein
VVAPCPALASPASAHANITKMNPLRLIKLLVFI